MFRSVSAGVWAHLRMLTRSQFSPEVRKFLSNYFKIMQVHSFRPPFRHMLSYSSFSQPASQSVWDSPDRGEENHTGSTFKPTGCRRLYR